MKTKKIITTAALVSFGVTLLSPIALAESKSTAGEGTITYKEDKGKEEVVDPEDPKKPVEPGDGGHNEDEGALRVDFVSHLRFTEDAKITTNAGTFYANPTKVKPLTSGEGETPVYGDPVERGNFVQITDKRALKEGKSAGWKLSAELTKQFTTGKSELKGATLDYVMPTVNSKSGTVDPADVVAKGFELSKDGGGANVLTAAAEKGWGTYTVEYGTAKDATMDKGVKLTVPANTPLEAAKYTAEITWTISEL